MKTFRDCKRKHWLQKVAKIETDRVSAGAERGKKLHGLVEEYLKTKPSFPNETILDFYQPLSDIDPDLYKGLKSANLNPNLVSMRELHHNPNEDYSILIEQEFDFNGLIIGFMDVVVLDRRSGELEVSIHDHKFTSSKNYIPTEDNAKVDPQTIFYANTLIKYFSLNSITFNYDYYGTKTIWEKNLNLSLTKEEICLLWNQVSFELEKVINNYSIQNGSNTTPNFMSCSKYGGCEFKSVCFKNN